MLAPQQVRNLTENAAECEHIEVEGNGHHSSAVIVSSAFEGKTHLARYRLTKGDLKARLQSNELHALSVSVAATPVGWAVGQQPRAPEPMLLRRNSTGDRLKPFQTAS